MLTELLARIPTLRRSKKPDAHAAAFAFGDPVPVLDGYEWTGYLDAYWTGHYYEPPVSPYGLAKTLRSNVHHAAAIYLKRNILVSTFQPSAALSSEAFSRFALDFLVFGNAFLQVIRARNGRILSLRPSPAKYTRVGKDGAHWWAPLELHAEQLVGPVVHLQEPDPNQEIYGVPEYYAGIQSALLNEQATLFRRNYYKNGNHAGVIFYLTDAEIGPDQAEALKEAIKASKGPGNFRNLFLYAPGGKEKGIQVIPVGEATAKDEFANIKAVTARDVQTIHRVPSQILGVDLPPGSTAADPEDVARVFAYHEIGPLQARFTALNAELGANVFTFAPYQIPPAATPAA